jgi:hypothetical protein
MIILEQCGALGTSLKSVGRSREHVSPPQHGLDKNFECPPSQDRVWYLKRSHKLPRRTYNVYDHFGAVWYAWNKLKVRGEVPGTIFGREVPETFFGGTAG